MFLNSSLAFLSLTCPSLMWTTPQPCWTESGKWQTLFRINLREVCFVLQTDISIFNLSCFSKIKSAVVGTWAVTAGLASLVGYYFFWLRTWLGTTSCKCEPGYLAEYFFWEPWYMDTDCLRTQGTFLATAGPGAWALPLLSWSGKLCTPWSRISSIECTSIATC